MSQLPQNREQQPQSQPQSYSQGLSYQGQGQGYQSQASNQYGSNAYQQGQQGQTYQSQLNSSQQGQVNQPTQGTQNSYQQNTYQPQGQQGTWNQPPQTNLQQSPQTQKNQQNQQTQPQQWQGQAQLSNQPQTSQGQQQNQPQQWQPQQYSQSNQSQQWQGSQGQQQNQPQLQAQQYNQYNQTQQNQTQGQQVIQHQQPPQQPTGQLNNQSQQLQGQKTQQNQPQPQYQLQQQQNLQGVQGQPQSQPWQGQPAQQQQNQSQGQKPNLTLNVQGPQSDSKQTQSPQKQQSPSIQVQLPRGQINIQGSQALNGQIQNAQQLLEKSNQPFNAQISTPSVQGNINISSPIKLQAQGNSSILPNLSVNLPNVSVNLPSNPLAVQVQLQSDGKQANQGENLQQTNQGLSSEPPKEMTSPQIQAYMKKKPYTQKIGNIEFTYSFFSKKQASFILSHDRFLYLKGYESISYAREFNSKTVLPFTEESQIPKAKVTFPLTQIEKVAITGENLVIQFSGKTKTKWEFVCPTKDCASQWKIKLDSAKSVLDDFKNSGNPNFDDFLRARQALKQQEHANQQQITDQMLNTPINLQTNNYQNINQPIRSQYNQQNPQPQPFQNPNRPTSVLYEGPLSAKINSFIEGNNPQLRSYMNQSMSRIPLEGKEYIKSEIKRIKRNWIDQFLGGEQEVELFLNFRNYVQRIAEVIINELYIHQEAKIYPSHEFTKDFASYILDDIYIQVYFQVDDTPSSKNTRYKTSVTEFKNFEYLIGATKNEGVLKVPFMTLFEYKGFLGMAKSRLGDGRGFKNREFYDLINRRQFEEITKISAETLLNESKCKIVSYDRRNSGKFSTQYNKVYFVERLTDFLPYYGEKDFGPAQNKILRRQMINDEEFSDQIFRDRIKQIRSDKIFAIVDKKIEELIKVLENQQIYFTNSQELTQLIHLFGLNVHHLGTIFKKTRLTWLKKIFQAEIAARCLKNVFRLDLQNSILQNYQGNNQERQQEREKNRVVSFLNVVFGNTEPTFRLWRNLNTSAVDKYQVKIWDNEYTDINTGYLLQAIQTHFKIVLTESVSERKFFRSMSSFGPRDFVRFVYEGNVYNLDFTNIFELIHQSFQEENLESFQTIGQILIKETSNNVPYMGLLDGHPIHDKISQFFLNFISPEENSELYDKIESKYLPHKFLYESKFAQIKWYLKANKSDRIGKAVNFIEEHARRWLGDFHPLFTQLNRMLAEYFSESQMYYSKALKHATASLNMQQALFEGDSEPLWRDYYLIGKVHYLNNHIQDSLSYLTKAKSLVKVENLTEFQVYSELGLMLAKCYFSAKYYKESYSTVREVYKMIRENRDERSLVFIVQAATLIKQLLQINQEHESYYKFVESDFSSIVYAFADYPALMNQSIKMITIPYLKNVILKSSKNRVRLLSIIEELSKIKQSQQSCNTYIRAKISQGTFPKSYLHCLKDIDSVIDEILANQMIERWKGFNSIANQSILDKIGNSQINRGFEFLANMTALFNFLGQEVLEELFIMEK